MPRNCTFLSSPSFAVPWRRGGTFFRTAGEHTPRKINEGTMCAGRGFPKRGHHPTDWTFQLVVLCFTLSISSTDATALRHTGRRRQDTRDSTQFCFVTIYFGLRHAQHGKSNLKFARPRNVSIPPRPPPWPNQPGLTLLSETGVSFCQLVFFIF